MDDLSVNTIVENIWNTFSKPLRGYIKRHVNKDQDVEDILQNVFFKILNNICNLQESDKIHAWIYSITKNTITDFYRAQKHDSCNIELSDEIMGEVQDDTTVNDEISQCLKAMIGYLPDKYRQAIILTEFENLTQRELSEKLGLSISGVKSRVQRARKMLKDMLIDCCQFEYDHLGNVIDYKRKCDDCKFC